MKRTELEYWQRQERIYNDLHEKLLKSDHFVQFEPAAWQRVLDARAQVAKEQAEVDAREAKRRELVGGLPAAWGNLHLNVPCEPYREKVTLRLDSEVLRFFRKMGKGYQGRINAVLDAYVHVRKAKLLEEWEEDRGY